MTDAMAATDLDREIDELFGRPTDEGVNRFRGPVIAQIPAIEQRATAPGCESC